MSDSGKSDWTMSQIAFSSPKLKHGIDIGVSLKKGRLAWQNGKEQGLFSQRHLELRSSTATSP